MQKNNRITGFTTVELIVSITLSAILILGILPLLFTFFGSLQDAIGRSKQANDIQSALRMISSDLVRARALLRFSDILDKESLTESLRRKKEYKTGYWDFRGSGSDKRTLILRLPTFSGLNPQSEFREPISRGSTAECEDNSGSIEFYNAIYYIDDNTLYRRSLVPSPYEHTVPGKYDFRPGGVTDTQRNRCWYARPYHKTSCRATVGAYGCEQKDVTVLTNVSRFSIDYFDKPESTTPKDYYTLPDGDGLGDWITHLPGEPKDVQITIATKRTTDSAKDSIISMTMRGALPW